MDDERLSKINAEKEGALKKSNDFYDNLLIEGENLYNKQIGWLDEWEKGQNDILDKNFEFQKGLIEQQKDKAQKNYRTEVNKALNDYAAYINPYGYQAERIAENGLNTSGVNETSKLGAYGLYQNRAAAANKALQDAFTEFDNDINAARLQNDVQKAQNALTKLENQLKFAESLYNTKASIGENKLKNEQTLNNTYYQQYQDLISQQNYEKEFEYKKERDKIADEQWQKEYNLAVKNSNKSSSSGGGGGGGNSGSGGGTELTNGVTITDANGNTKTYPEGSIVMKGAVPYKVENGQLVPVFSSSSSSSNGADNLGNSSDTMKKSNYYWKEKDGSYTTQPSYVYNQRLTKATKKGNNVTAGDLGMKVNGTGDSYTVWKGIDDKGKTAYYVWNKNANTYIDVTELYNNYPGYRTPTILETRMKSVGGNYII